MTDTTTPNFASAPPVERPRRGWAGRLILAVLVLAVSAAVGWYFLVQTYHLATVSPNILYRDGNRDVREFAHAVRWTGAKTVVSLVDDRELADPAKPQFRAEAQWCRSHRVTQIRIPVRLGGWPTPGQLREFLTIVADPVNRPVLVHCAQGVRRTGMFVAAYQLSVADRSPASVRAAVLGFGHKPRDTDDVRTFINHYDPATAALPATMPAATGGGD